MYPKKLGQNIPYYFKEGNLFHNKHHCIKAYLHKNYTTPMHKHQFFEINIILSGSGRHYIENTYLDAKTGDVFVIPPETSHGYYSEEKLDIYHILIKSDFLRKYSEELSQINGFDLLFNIEPQIRKSSGKRLNLNTSKSLTYDFKTELERIITAQNSNNFVYENILTLAFIANLCEKMHTSPTYNEDIIQTISYIKNNLDADLTLDLLAEISHVSISTLNRQFRSTVGMSPMNYVLSCRIATAKHLLDYAKHSKTEVAAMCGFYDVSHLNRYLKRNG